MQRAPARRVPVLDARLALQEHLGRAGEAALAGVEERRVPLRVLRVDGRLPGDEDPDDLRAAARRRKVHRRPAEQETF